MEYYVKKLQLFQNLSYSKTSTFMEEKMIRTSIFFNDTVFNESAEQPIDVDLTLQDYCPDISKIFK